ncbi:MAG: quinolinate synthase NadA [Peptococcaceae bacterium]|nr:quinolinate synthase NadA [Peptococcaceae bacterium]
MEMQQLLPTEYLELDPAEMDKRITTARKSLGNQLVILGHHYQRDDVICYADYTGDSLKLSQLAAQEQAAKYIIFCGVHFMAETADILTSDAQQVILPDLQAGCSMADMADIAQVEECWEILSTNYAKDIVPVTYVNSSAEIKAFCGRHGGLTCTSSNARKVFEWAWQEDKIILFLPDEHLGRNTGTDLGVAQAEMLLWDPELPDRELPDVPPRLMLWHGYCSVHQRFTPEHIAQTRLTHPGIKVIVHPECSREVVQLADLNGSTEYIIRMISQAPPGSEWAIGTELNLVNRLAQLNPDKTILSLNPTMCLCVTMNRIDRPHLLWTLENLVQGKVINQISVAESTAVDAVIALQRMLAISQ